MPRIGGPSSSSGKHRRLGARSVGCITMKRSPEVRGGTRSPSAHPRSRRFPHLGPIPAGAAGGLAAAFLFGLGGCGSFINMPDRVAETQAQVTEVERRQEALAREVAELKRLLETQESILREMRADQGTSGAELRNTIEVLRNQLDQANRQTTKTRKAANPPPPDTTGGHSPTGQNSGSPPALEEEGLYQVALQNLQQGRYPLAITGFREYLSKFPDGAYGDDAQYGIAESYYAQSDFPTAAIEFRALVDRYPTSERVPAALYKAGLSYFESGREDLGRAYLERVVNEYPYNDEALKAKDRLERLN
jgi:tol-pal system protein YbgF